MAKNEDGDLHGGLGNLIYYKRKGKKCVRVKSDHYNDANTPVQKKNRGRLRLSVKFLKDCKKIIKIGYQDSDKDNYFNEASSRMINDCFIQKGSDLSIDFSKVKIARGNIPAPEECSMDISGNILQVKWRPYNKYERAYKSDHAVVLTYSANEETHYFINAALRSDAEAKIEIPKSVVYPIHVWMFFHNPSFNVGESKDKISDSVYLGMI